LLFSGPKGPPGLPGASGPQGRAGETGSTGRVGPAGSTGAKGRSGLPSDVAQMGPPGAAGNTGATGFRGFQGKKRCASEVYLGRSTVTSRIVMWDASSGYSLLTVAWQWFGQCPPGASRMQGLPSSGQIFNI